MANLSDFKGEDGISLNPLTDQQVHKAHLTMMELGNYCEGDVTKEEMRTLIEMITPTDLRPVSILSRYNN